VIIFVSERPLLKNDLQQRLNSNALNVSAQDAAPRRVRRCIRALSSFGGHKFAGYKFD